MEAKSSRKRGMQARGVARRQLLVDSAWQILLENDIDQISLADIAQHTGIPKSSAYHLFPDVSALYSEVARQMAELLASFEF